MTQEYLDWFEKHINKPFFSVEDKEDLLVYCWLAWRDSKRSDLPKEDLQNGLR